jgi:hypothetical protein
MNPEAEKYTAIVQRRVVGGRGPLTPRSQVRGTWGTRYPAIAWLGNV